MIGIKNPSFTDKTWNPRSTGWNPESKTVLDFLTWGKPSANCYIFHA